MKVENAIGLALIYVVGLFLALLGIARFIVKKTLRGRAIGLILLIVGLLACFIGTLIAILSPAL